MAHYVLITLFRLLRQAVVIYSYILEINTMSRTDHLKNVRR